MTKNKDTNKVVKLKKKKESLQFDGVISKVKLKKDIPEIWFKINGER